MMLPNEITNKKILLSPLNWGYGHLSRCISIIEHLLKNKNELYFAGREADFAILKQYFNDGITYIEHAPYPFIFNENGFRMRYIWRNLIPVSRRYRQELKTVSKLISEHSIDVVLSDHRYGFRSSTCCSIFITHQCKLPIKGLWFPLQWLHRYFIRKFNYIWIVDDEEKRYAGELSTRLNTNSMYIGIQSRFKRQELAEAKPLKEIECVLLVSGPLPFSNKLITHFTEGFCAESDPKFIIGSEDILERLPAALRPYFKSNHDWLAADKLLISSKKIMSYCGYSTLMDVQFLECETNFIATEGQLEQNYLMSRTKKASAINRGFKI
jgi:hypothetical protein